MEHLLLLMAAVIVVCVISNRISSKLGMPMLLGFIVLGMIFGADGIFRIAFNDYALSRQVCSIALIFIMFYGGFGTKWSQAKPIAAKAILLSSAGTVVTAALVGLFCWLVLGVSVWESFLIGSVISSTDAASVFSILRSKRLGLKYQTASLLEVESGSNDPVAYMLTMICLSLMRGDLSGGAFAWMLVAQVLFGVALGIAVAWLAKWMLRRLRPSDGMDSVFLVAVALAAYALPAMIGGNGYLSVYITGIILGNSRLHNKTALVNFFDGTTGLMQMLLFFLLGLLSFPSQLPQVALLSLGIAVFLTFVARPLAVTVLLKPLGCKWRQIGLVSWSGMRGAASIVFAIMAVTDPAVTEHDIFHIVFFIVLFSILLQGTLLAPMAKKIGMTDGSDVMKTFTDYADMLPVGFIRVRMPEGHPWENQHICDLQLPPDLIAVLVLRGEKRITPNGRTQLQPGDELILSGVVSERIEGVSLYEKHITKGDEWINLPVKEVPSYGNLIIMIQRGDRVIIPRGNTVIRQGDLLVINDTEEK